MSLQKVLKVLQHFREKSWFWQNLDFHTFSEHLILVVLSVLCFTLQLGSFTFEKLCGDEASVEIYTYIGFCNKKKKQKKERKKNECSCTIADQVVLPQELQLLPTSDQQLA